MKHTESKLQEEIVDILTKNDWIVLHPANERDMGISDSLRMKRLGVKKGAPDLLLWKETSGQVISLWLELKAPKGIRSPEQHCFEHIANSLGIEYRLVKSVSDIADLTIKERL